ncbi:MAG: YqcI/YcgG family protein [Tuberibacillus sp.]
MSLYTKEFILDSDLEHWKKNAFVQFDIKMRDKDKPFPCIPATIGHKLGHLRYVFLPHPHHAESVKGLAESLELYAESYQKMGKYTSLIVFYRECESTEIKATDYEEIFWKQLNSLSKKDKKDWPAHIPHNLENPMWEFCFHGESFFMFCATPAHKHRLSRHFPCLMLAITPRWVLTEFNASESRSIKTRTAIRKRLEAYDTAPIHPELNMYGKEDNYEWKQYFLRDDDTALSRCPFHKRITEKLTPD